ncbi:RDD family protein [Myroides sp. LJL116]
MEQQKFKRSSKIRRKAAFLIDHFIIVFPILVVLLILFWNELIDVNNLTEVLRTLVYGLIIGMVLYFFKDLYKGVSLGKWIMGIMVRDESNPNKVPSLPRLFLRNLFLILGPIEYLIWISSQQNKRLGDRVTNVAVLNNPIKAPLTSRIITLVSIVVVFFAFLFFTTSISMKQTDAYLLAIDEIQSNEQLNKEIGTIVGYGKVPLGYITAEKEQGTALLVIKAVGEKTSRTIIVSLEKHPSGQWRLIEMHRVDGTILYPVKD